MIIIPLNVFFFLTWSPFSITATTFPQTQAHVITLCIHSLAVNRVKMRFSGRDFYMVKKGQVQSLGVFWLQQGCWGETAWRLNWIPSPPSIISVNIQDIIGGIKVVSAETRSLAFSSTAAKTVSCLWIRSLLLFYWHCYFRTGTSAQ